MLEKFVTSETYVVATVECMERTRSSEECGKLQLKIKSIQIGPLSWLEL